MVRARDKWGGWYNAKVLDTKPGEVKIHFVGFKKSKINVFWLSLSSETLELPEDRPAAAPTQRGADAAAGGPSAADEEPAELLPPIEVSVNQTIQVSQCGKWYRAKVMQLLDTECLVHYMGWNSRYDHIP